MWKIPMVPVVRFWLRSHRRDAFENLDVRKRAYSRGLGGRGQVRLAYPGTRSTEILRIWRSIRRSDRRSVNEKLPLRPRSVPAWAAFGLCAP